VLVIRYNGKNVKSPRDHGGDLKTGGRAKGTGERRS
jgi:hypothetical protein